MSRKSTSFSLPPDVLEGLRALSKDEERSQAEILSELVRRRVLERELWASVQTRLADHEERIRALESPTATRREPSEEPEG